MAETELVGGYQYGRMYENILVPTDGSDAAKIALEHALWHADQDGARLHTLYVAEIGHLSESLDEEAFDTERPPK